jgi:PAS domain S-box-containing protein
MHQRWARLSLRAKALMVVSLPVVAFLLSAALINHMESEKARSEEAVKNTLEIRAQLQNFYIVLISAESEIRNYGLNGHEEGLQPWGMIRPSVDALFTKIGELLHGNGEQLERLARLRPLVNERLAGLTELRKYYQSPEGRQTPPPAGLIQRAKISPDVLVALSEIITKQAKLQQERTKTDEVQQARLRVAVIGLGLTGVLSGILAAIFFAGKIRQRLFRLEEGVFRLGEGLSPNLKPDGNDEISQLERAVDGAGRVVVAQSEELKLALEGAEVLIWELEPSTRRLKYQAGAEALRNAKIPAELIPETVEEWIAVVHVEDRGRLQHELNRIGAERGSLEIEYRVVIRGGEIRWMSVKAQSHSLAGETPHRLLGVLADITAQKNTAREIERQAQELINSREALQQQTRILQSILDSMGDGVVVADTSGKFILFNPAARQLLGREELVRDVQHAQFYGLYLPDMVTPYPADQIPFIRAVRGESVDNVEMFMRPAGAPEGTWASVTARPLREEDGEIRGGVIVIRDITASKRVAEALNLAKQEAEDANHAKSEFLSRMSHELRTPLNSILGFAQLLELGDLTEQQTDNIQHILKGGYHLLELINEILDLARIESGRMSLSSEPVRIGDVIKESVDLVRPLAIQENISLSSEKAILCDRYVQADRQRFIQVLLNLLSNAIKFNRSGGSVMVSFVESLGNKIRVEVVDTGSGISKEGLNKIFRPFERLEADRTDVSGTGLGLALSKRLMEAMGGTIGVESAVGLGSRFFLEFAMIDNPTLLLETEDTKAALANSHLQSQRGTVLYIEDNSSNLKLVEQILSHCPGVRLLSAMQGHLGLDLAELHAPDWILLDLHLPDIPGHEVLRRLRLNPRTADIPVTVLSADATVGQINRLMEAGARDYLTKPLDVRKLLSLLKEIIPNGGLAGEAVNTYAERDHSS